MFYGQPALVRRTAELAMGHWIAPPRMVVTPHAHDDAHFMFITSGEFVSGADGAPASLIFNPAQTYHCDRFASASGSFFAIVLSEGDDSLPRVPTYVDDPHAHGLAIRLMRECGRWQPDSDAIASELHLELLGCLNAERDRETQRPAWLDDVVELLEQSRAYSIRDVSRAIGVHRVHLTRTFRRFYRCTPGEWVRTRRAQRAADLLRTKRMPLCEIALAAGFADQSHFTTAFRKTYGVTPSAYRRQVSSAKDSC